MADKKITRPPMTATEAVEAYEFYSRTQNVQNEIHGIMRDIERKILDMDEAPHPQPHSWATSYGRYLKHTLDALGVANDALTPPESSF